MITSTRQLFFFLFEISEKINQYCQKLPYDVIRNCNRCTVVSKNAEVVLLAIDSLSVVSVRVLSDQCHTRIERERERETLMLFRGVGRSGVFA